MTSLDEKQNKMNIVRQLLKHDMEWSVFPSDDILDDYTHVVMVFTNPKKRKEK